jgi:hypothetical protein
MCILRCVATLQKHREERDVQKNYGDENLGETFEETPWVPPSLEVVSRVLLRRFTTTNRELCVGVGVPLEHYLSFRSS